MAKYLVTYLCGCEKTISITGPQAYRAGKLAYLASRRCDEHEREYQRQEAWTWATSRGLPLLQGTQEQVEQAEVLRREMIASVEKIIDQMKVAPGPHTQEEEQEAVAQVYAAYGLLLKKDQAQFWIENRDRMVHVLLNTLLREL